MSLAALWARYNDAFEIRYTDSQKAKTILLSLAEESLPHELYIRTYILLVSKTVKSDKMEEYLNFAERMWGAYRAAYALDSLENKTICELSSELWDARDLLRMARRLDDLDVVIAEERRRASELPST